MSPGKSQVAIGFLRNTGTDPLGKGFNCSLREVRRFEICEICWRLLNENKNVVGSNCFSKGVRKVLYKIRCCRKNNNKKQNKKRCQDTPDGIFGPPMSKSVHALKTKSNDYKNKSNTCIQVH